MRTALAYPVHVVGVGFDIVVGVRIEMLPCLPEVTPSLYHVVHMRNHAGRDERMTIVVEVKAPWIAGTFRK
jgi:hypothetical protein